MGIDTEQWRARIGTYNGGRGCRTSFRAFPRSLACPAITWTTESSAPLPVQAGVSVVSLWIVLCSLRRLWKKVGSSQSTKPVSGCSYHSNEDTKAPVLITVCVSLMITISFLLYSLALLLVMAGDVELNPGPGMGKF